jgi:acetyl esterase/lipase
MILWVLAMGMMSFAQGQLLQGSGDLNLEQSWSQEPDGWTYPVAVSVPAGAAPTQGFPVGVLLHGNGGNGFQMLNLGGNLLTDHILVAPTGYLNSWNLCGENSEAPDIAMLSDLVAQLSAFDNVDASHIRLIGSSNGAGLVNQAFIELDDPGVDAFVAIVSQMNQPQYHQGAFHRPSGVTNAPLSFCGYDEVVVPPQGRKYLSICNHNDSVVPYDGGPAVGNFFLPAEVAIHQVALQQGHVGPPVPGEPLAGTGLTAFSYLDGDVVLVRGNAGHGTSPSQTMVAAEFLSIDDVAPPPSPEENCAEDLDLDGLVSVSDVLILLGQFGCVIDCGPSDITVDGLVGVSDVLAMLNVFGTPCSSVDEVPSVTVDSTYAISVDTAIVYAQGLSHASWNSTASTALPLLLDVYQPQGAEGNRPAIVVIHGGGFTGGSRSGWRPVSQAEYFASRGWVAFSIDYRLLSDFGTVPQEWADSVFSAVADSVEMAQLAQAMAIYPAHRDAKAALRWVAAHAEDYSINMDYLTVGGGSAGAINSVGVSVTELTDFTDELTVAQDPTLATTHLGQNYEVQTILDFWGAPTSVNLWEGVYGVDRFDPGDPPLFIAHGTADSTVVFSNGEMLQETWENHGIPHAFYPLEGAGHGPWDATVPDDNGNPQTLFELAFDFMVLQQALTVE